MPGPRHRPRCRAARPPLALESLEGRCVPAAANAFLQTNLVADQAGQAAQTDAHLVNPWGVSLSPSGGDFWVSDNGTGVTTLDKGDVGGSPLTVDSLVVTIPGGAPTGQVFNTTNDFVVTNGTASAKALFIFASESGQITGWNPGVPPPAPSANAQPAAQVAGAVFKGLAIGTSAASSVLFAADFHNNRVDVFDKNFALITNIAPTFLDPNLPAGFAPFNVQVINGKVYVTYAQQTPGSDDETHGPGLGVVDAFDTDGRFLFRVATGGALNAPWGLALAPAGFGPFGGDLLVGNFGDGHINVFDPNGGGYRGTFQNAAGNPIHIDGLWGLTFGNGTTAGDASTLYFTAGTDDEAHGLFGSLKPTTPAAPTEAVGADAGGGPQVTVFDAAGHTLRSFQAYAAAFTGGVRVAVGDVTGDGVPDVVTAPGAGGGPDVRVFDGASGALVREFLAYGAAFTGGVNVAVGDANGDGFADIVTGADAGGGPHVKAFSGQDGTVLQSFLAYGAAFTGGVRVAAGDVNGDGFADIVTGAGPGGGPHVEAFSGADGSLLKSFFAYDAAFRGGVFVAAGDVTGDGTADIVTGAGAGGGPHVRVFDSASGAASVSLLAYDGAFTGGVRVAVRDLNGDGRADVITGPGAGGGPDVRVRDGASAALNVEFAAFDPAFLGGVFVG